MTAQAKLCPAIAALNTSGFWLGVEKNWIYLEVGDHDLNVDQGDEDVEAVRGQYRRVVFEKLILMTICWWWWWCWPMKVYKECRWRQQGQKRWKEVILNKPNSAFYLYQDRTLLLFSRPMRDKDTSALREMFQYSSLAEKPFDQWEIATHWRAFQIQEKTSSLWPSFRPNQT